MVYGNVGTNVLLTVSDQTRPRVDPRYAGGNLVASNQVVKK